MRKYVESYVWLFSLAGIVIVLDQWTKSLVRTNLPEGTVYLPELWLTQYARIVRTSNTGSAFGLFPSLGGVITVLSFFVSLAIIYYYPQIPRRDWPLRVALGLQLGGAVGNLLDRLVNEGRVTDFVSLGSFPVFNVADASISTGVAILVLAIWLQERKEKAQGQQPDEDSEQTSQTETPSKARIESLPEELQGG